MNDLFTELSLALSDDADRFLLKTITQTDSAEVLACSINDFCFEYFGQHILSCHFARLSMGASFGLRLENGKDIFLKISKLRSETSDKWGFSINELKEMAKLQQILHSKAFPCPAILRQPMKYHEAIFTTNEYFDIGAQKDAHDPVIRRASAQGFAQLIDLLKPYTSSSGVKEVDIYRLETIYPAPHNPNTDFSRNAADAGWIDEIALRSKNMINSINKNVILGHCDWSMKNMRFMDNKIVMVYDWDSIILQDEYHMLATAASTFPMTWDIPVQIIPSQEEAYEFIKEYEQARGITFSKQEWAKISACITYYFCYTARCQVSAGDKYEGSFIEALDKMKGDNYLHI